MTYSQQGDCQACDIPVAYTGPLNEQQICASCVEWLAQRAQKKAEDKAFRDREPFVQEVIAKHKALTKCVLYGRSDCENEDAALFDVLSKLAEWKP